MREIVGLEGGTGGRLYEEGVYAGGLPLLTWAVPLLQARAARRHRHLVDELKTVIALGRVKQSTRKSALTGNRMR